MSLKSPKKTELIEFRISHEAKSEFLQKCKSEDRSASEVIRDLMRDHVSEHSNRPQQRFEWRRFMSDLLHRNPISVSAICAATFLGVSAMTTTAAADPAQAFGAIDSDGDGTISLDEYLTASEPVAAIAMNSDGSDARMISRYEARRLLKQNYREYDENRDGRVDEREFMPRFDLTSRMSFYTVDQNGDGKIELDELLAFSTGASAEVARLEDVFARLDGNQNGAITLQEYQIVRL